MSEKFAVVGATGRVGRHIVEVLRERGHEAVAVSRTTGVDVITGDGLANALEGVTCMIDAASGPEAAQDPATAFFTTATRNLHDYGQRAGVREIVVISIIGTDRFTAGYCAAKAAHEQAHARGPLPVKVVRAAQFHEFVGQLLDWGTQGYVAYVQKMRTQLVAARTVAETVVDIATGARPAGTPFIEVAGPREDTMAGAAALLAARRGHPLKVQEFSDPADPDREQFETAGLLPGPDAILAGPAYEDWLDSTAGPIRATASTTARASRPASSASHRYVLASPHGVVARSGSIVQ